MRSACRTAHGSIKEPAATPNRPRRWPGQLAMQAGQTGLNLVGRTVAEVERDLILETLKHCLGNRTHAAKILGVSIRTLRNKLNEYAGAGVPIPPPGGGGELRGAA